MFRILCISGSPRRDGNTELLLKKASEPFLFEGHAVRSFFLSEKKVKPCRACDLCLEKGECVLKDDFHELLEESIICDAFIVGSPVYMRNVSSQLLAAFDRFHCVFRKRPFKDKICFGGAVAVGGSPNSQGITLTVIYNFLLSLGICCVPAVINGVSALARRKGEVGEYTETLDEARTLGENILSLLKKVY